MIFFSKIASMMLVVDDDEVDGAAMAVDLDLDLDFSVEEDEEKLIESI